MAKITLTIEDLPGNKVKVVSDPNFETMMKMHVSGTPLTSAHGYALTAINAIRGESKKRAPTGIIIPKIRH